MKKKLQRPDTVPDYPTRPIREGMVARGIVGQILFNMLPTAKAPKPSVIAKKEYGCKGKDLVEVYMQFCEMTDQQPDARIVELRTKGK
jgi:hypothetical protein